MCGSWLWVRPLPPLPSLGEITTFITPSSWHLEPWVESVFRKFLQSSSLLCCVLRRLCKPIYIMIIIMARVKARNKQMPARARASPGNQDSADLGSVNIWRKPTNNDPVHSAWWRCAEWFKQNCISASSRESFKKVLACLKFRQHSVVRRSRPERNNYSAKKKCSTSAILSLGMELW